MDKKTKILFYTLLHYLKIREVCVLKEGFSISTKIDDVLCKPYIKELNIKLRYIEEEEPEAYRDEEGTEKEG